ncbi:glycosyltransferase family 2 protein [Hydnomerulius pinastri MD-312]|uniref:Glycosyltransferase family 2 protein n=1 Tax=Hydnomerulius pinastri MD-312 TaxID=994086 RepID=A0A0C9W8B9_9AGAM|nr:glycosyltransferase family 2 protein [Hydnomerulius pinastri MD-312]
MALSKSHFFPDARPPDSPAKTLPSSIPTQTPFNQASSQAHMPLVNNASPFQRGDQYDDEYDERKSFQSDNFDNRGRLMSNRDDSNSNYGTESYAPSKNTFQNADEEGLMAKEALAGGIMENEATELPVQPLGHPQFHERRRPKRYHDLWASTNDSRPDWYFEGMAIVHWNNHVGYVGYTPQGISKLANANHSLGTYDGMVYDLTDYVNYSPAVKAPYGQQVPAGTDVQFMDTSIVNLFKYSSGQDLMKALDNINVDSASFECQNACLRDLSLIGMVDNRSSHQRLFSQYILLALSIVMASIITFKFIASINFGTPLAPEDHDKFVICQVPCYAEGGPSLRRTIDSLAQLKYGDGHKLIPHTSVTNPCKTVSSDVYIYL